jgi:hypothetical protein
MGRAKTFFDLGNDSVRIFFARIIRCEDRVISMSIRNFTHERTLLPVAIAPAAKNHNQTIWSEFPQRFENVAERVRRVCVIDEDLKLSLRWN